MAPLGRRGALAWVAGLPWVARAQTEPVAALLSAGGVIIAFRHANAPGTFDPPGFRLDDCSTQRNLDDEGRAQAARIGAWFQRRGLRPARVRTSPWCRCVDTAAAAFGAERIERWDALASPTGSDAALRRTRIDTLRAALRQAPAGRFEAWVTHQFVLQDLAGESTASGEALVLRAARAGTVEVLARALLF